MVMKEAFGRASEDERNRGVRGRLGIAAAKTALFLGGVKDLQPLQAETVKIYPEIPLEENLERQAGRYTELEFYKHPEIEISKGKFKDLIMGLAIPQPENFRGRFNSPVAVFGQIPIKDQCERAGIDYSLGGLNVCDWPEDPKGYKTPNSLYLSWTDEGARFMNRKVEDVRKELAPDERGGTEFDGIALYIVNPRVLKTRSLDLPGTAVGAGRAPSLGLWNGQPKLRFYFVGGALPRFGSLVCGRQK